MFVFLFLCVFCSGYSVSLCCSVYCLCVNVYCTVLYCCQRVSTQLQLTNISYHISIYWLFVSTRLNFIDQKSHFGFKEYFLSFSPLFFNFGWSSCLRVCHVFISKPCEMWSKHSKKSNPRAKCSQPESAGWYVDIYLNDFTIRFVCFDAAPHT